VALVDGSEADEITFDMCAAPHAFSDTYAETHAEAHARAARPRRRGACARATMRDRVCERMPATHALCAVCTTACGALRYRSLLPTYAQGVNTAFLAGTGVLNSDGRIDATSCLQSKARPQIFGAGVTSMPLLGHPVRSRVLRTGGRAPTADQRRARG
jgi:hypothetical protein